MKRTQHVALTTLTCLVLASCGGGGGGAASPPPPPGSTNTTLSGTAAAGTPIVNGTVSLTCGDFNTTTTTNTVGGWQAVVPSDHLPCMVKVASGTVGVGGPLNTTDLYSFGGSTTATIINVTPITTLALGAAAYNASGTTNLSSFFGSTHTASTITTLTSNVTAELVSLQATLVTAGYTWPAVTSGTFNPISSSFTPAVGDNYDDLIAMLMASLAAQSITFDTLLFGYSQDILPIPSSTPPNEPTWSLLATVFDRGPYGDFEVTSIKFDDNGNALAVWGTSQTIWANRYTAGTGWGEAVQISPASSSSAYAAFVSLDKDGNGLALWRDEDGNGDQSVWSNRYTVGEGWGLPTKLSDAGSRYNIEVSNVRIAYFNNGTPLIMWAQFDNTGRSILNCVYSTASEACSAPAVVLATNAEEPSLANDDAGNIVIVWHKLEYSSGSIWAVHYQPGQGWSSSVLIHDRISTGQLRYPSVEFCGDGTGNIEWTEIPFGTYTGDVWESGFEFYNQEFVQYDMSPIGPEGSTCFGGQQHDFSVWVKDDSVHGSKSVWATHAAEDTGYVWDIESKLSADRVTIYAPQVVHNAAGNALAMWREYDGSRYALMSATFTPAGGWSLAAQVPDSGQPGNFSLALDSSTGDAVVTWTKGAHIYSRRYAL